MPVVRCMWPMVTAVRFRVRTGSILVNLEAGQRRAGASPRWGLAMLPFTTSSPGSLLMRTRLKLAALVGVIHLLSQTTHAALTQWRVDQGGNGHFYGVTTSKGTWDAAEAEAVAVGGHLVSIDSAAENEFVRLLCPPNPSAPGNACWIGLSRPDGGAWRWSDGSPVTYTNWGPGEPNNARGNEFWVWIYGPHSNNAGGDWNDHPQWDYAMHGVIEVVPAPTSLPVMLLVALARRRRSINGAA